MRKAPVLEITIPLLAAATIFVALPTKSAYLDTALAGLIWMESHALAAGDDGSIYPNVPGEEGTTLNDLTLYHGQPGRVHALLQAAVATGDPAWHRAAGRALRGLDSELDKALGAGYRNPGLYTGAAGIAAVYLQAAAHMEDGGTARLRAIALSDSILAWAQQEDEGLTWYGITDIISGTAGIGLYLLEAYRRSGEERYVESAVAAGRWLISVAERDNGTLFWPIGAGNETHYPNFAHGTSGVAFFLGEITMEYTPGGESLLSARYRGMQWLRNNGDGAGCVTFHHEGGGEDLQYVSWCHGPAGTGRLYLQDYLAGENHPSRAELLEPAQLGARYILDVGLEPGESPAGYWNNVSVCCGTAGLLNYMLDLYLATGEEEYLQHAKSCGDILLDRAVKEGNGAKWPQAEHRVRPELIQAQTGYMQGAAGISASLLRLYLVIKDRAGEIIRFPDELFLH